MAGTYNRKDHFYEKAKLEGYRSRAAYKLIEINKKFGLIKYGTKVLDLGCWPGGWLQVCRQKVGPHGIAVGIDLVETEAVGGNVHIIHGDARDDDIIERAKKIANGLYDVVISDMSPKITGIREVDQAASVGLAELALWFSEQMLNAGGSLVIKVFKGNDTELFIKSSRSKFEKLIRFEADSSRKTSTEFYIVGLGYKRDQ